MSGRVVAGLAIAALSCAGTGVAAGDATWENPVFVTVESAVAAAQRELQRPPANAPPALRFFTDLTLAAGDVSGRHPSAGVARVVVDDLVVTHPVSFGDDAVQRRTIERFLAEVPHQRTVLEDRLARFGYPELRGLVFLRLVGSVDAFSDVTGASSDRMSRVGGLTYFCRYMVLPLSYVGERDLHELRRAAARNPSLDVDDTIRRWQRESYASLVNTFRHELVHVHTNTTLDVPAYADRTAYPTWFHEGTATYLAADPHSGLSTTYREYQNLFFYLVQRHGVHRLQWFYGQVLSGSSDVASALREVYGIVDDDELFARSDRWHRLIEGGKNGLWLAAMVVVVAAFRGRDRAYIGWLVLLTGIGIALAAAAGLAEHLYGLRGPHVVLVVKALLAVLAVALGAIGIRRILQYRSRDGD